MRLYAVYNAAFESAVEVLEGRPDLQATSAMLGYCYESQSDTLFFDTRRAVGTNSMRWVEQVRIPREVAMDVTFNMLAAYANEALENLWSIIGRPGAKEPKGILRA